MWNYWKHGQCTRCRTVEAGFMYTKDYVNYCEKCAGEVYGISLTKRQKRLQGEIMLLDIKKDTLIETYNLEKEA